MLKAIQFSWFRAALCGLSLVLLTCGAMTTLATFDSASVQAQDGEDPEAEEGDDAAAPAANEAESAGKKKPTNMLSWAAKSLGWGYGIIFLLISFTLVALLVMNLMTARRENIVPMMLVEQFEAFLNEKQYQEAYELAKGDDSFLGQVLSAGLSKISSGYSPAIEAMQEIGEEENMKLEHRLSYMALIGSLSPMIGLFGTVHGMIDSFQTIAGSVGTPPASELAEGIATALFTTLIGLAIAIPALAAYNILRNRVARLVLEVGIISEGLMSRFQKQGEK